MCIIGYRNFIFSVFFVNKSSNPFSEKYFSLFNKNEEWSVKISQISKGIVEFIVIQRLRQKESSKEIWLAFSPIKSNYFNFMIQKATELGTTKFIPIIADRTIVRKINLNRFEKIVIESCEQSNRIKLPIIEKPISFESFLKKNENLDIIFGDLNTNNNKLNIKSTEPLCILIGPEGDFTEKEREKILKLKNIIPLKINENILRAETAAISMISIIAFQLLS